MSAHNEMNCRKQTFYTKEQHIFKIYSQIYYYIQSMYVSQNLNKEIESKQHNNMIYVTYRDLEE